MLLCLEFPCPPTSISALTFGVAVVHQDAIFLKLAGPQLVQMFIGDGAKLVRDAFKLAKEKVKKEKRGGAIIFIDELDAVGTKRFESGLCCALCSSSSLLLSVRPRLCCFASCALAIVVSSRVAPA